MITFQLKENFDVFSYRQKVLANIFNYYKKDIGAIAFNILQCDLEFENLAQMYRPIPFAYANARLRKDKSFSGPEINWIKSFFNKSDSLITKGISNKIKVLSEKYLSYQILRFKLECLLAKKDSYYAKDLISANTSGHLREKLLLLHYLTNNSNWTETRKAEYESFLDTKLTFDAYQRLFYRVKNVDRRVARQILDS